MPIFSDNAPRIRVYASSHQTLTVHGNSTGSKVMQYNSVAFNNGPTGFYNWNGATGYASKPYSIQCGQNGQYLVRGGCLQNRTTTATYIHMYGNSWDSSGNSVDSKLVSHDYDAGPGSAGWRQATHEAVFSVPANGIVQINWYLNTTAAVSTYLSHGGDSYCFFELIHLS